jgi:erythromycin esterase-like protein
MSTPHQALIDKIEQLPAQRVAEVEDFVDFLRSREDARSQGQRAKLCAGLGQR